MPGVLWSRVYLIEGESLARVDASLPWHTGAILDYIRSIGRRPEDLALILMTHSHPDHAGGAFAISGQTGAAIVAHAADTKTHRDRVVSLSYMGVFSSLNVLVPFLRRTPVSHVVSGSQSVPAFDDIQVVHSPGHTPGSVCYLMEERGVLFSGDTLFGSGTRLSRSVPFPGHDADVYRQPLSSLAELQFDALCGGHGVPIVGGASERLRQLLKAKPDPPTWGDYFKSIQKRLIRGRTPSGEES